jgi:AcrR family transcriptional regulator
MPPTRRKPKQVRRREIAAAALALLGERGPTAFTTAALARAVGVTTGALFRHFASLDEILDEVVRGAIERIQGTLPDPALPPLERLRRLAASRSEVLQAEPGLGWLLRSEQAAQVLPPAARRRLRDLAERTRAHVLAALCEGAAAGRVRADVDPRTLVVLFTATVHALGSGRSGRGGPEPSVVLDGLFRLLAHRGAACDGVGRG